MAVAALPASTVRKISSAQVISTISSVVKELVENAVDAGATNIDVRLDNYGLDSIEVADNGSGISRENAVLVCLPSHTSKIHSMCDLEKLESYGFRGEALSAICAVGRVTITTRTVDDEHAMAYTYDTSGKMDESRLAHIVKGTSICVTGLFRSLPVRRQIMSKGGREELKNIEHIVKSLALIRPDLRVCLSHNKCFIWQKSRDTTMKLSFMQITSYTIGSNMEDVHYEDEKLTLDMLIPKFDANLNAICLSTSSKAYFFYVNLRPVKDSKLDKLVTEEFQEYFGTHLPTRKYPYCVISLKVNPADIDVNLEPNKTKILITDQETVLKIVKDQFLKYYNKPFTESASKGESLKNTSSKKKSLDDVEEVAGPCAKKSKVEQVLDSQDSGIGSGSSQNTDSQSRYETNNLLAQETKFNVADGNRLTVNVTVHREGSTEDRKDANQKVDCANRSVFSPEPESDEINASKNLCSGIDQFSVPSVSNQLEVDNTSFTLEIIGGSDGSNAVASSGWNKHYNNSKNSDEKMSSKTISSVSLHENNQNITSNSDFHNEPFKKPLHNTVSAVNESFEKPLNNTVSAVNESFEKPLNNTVSAVNESFEKPLNNTVSAVSEAGGVIGETFKVSNPIDDCRDTSIDQFLDGIFTSDLSTPTCSQKGKSSEVGESFNKSESCCIQTEEEDDDKKLEEFLRCINDETQGPNLNLAVVNDFMEHSELQPPNADPRTENSALEGPNADEITASQWSKGHVFTNNKHLQGPAVLLEKSSNLQNDLLPASISKSSTAESKKTTAIDKLTDRSVSSQMGLKQFAGFTNFAREIRSEINEKKSFTDVAQELTTKWRGLLKSEQEFFAEKSSKAKEERLAKLERSTASTNVSPSVKRSKPERDLKPWLKYQRKVKANVSFQIKDLREKLQEPVLPFSETNSTSLLCKVNNPKEAACAWFYQENDSIGLINVLRLLEAVEFHKLLESMEVPSKILEKNIEFTEFDMSLDLWNTLLSLKTCCYGDNDGIVQEIIDQRIIFNGIKIILKDVKGVLTGFITDVPQNISYFGLDELKETLSLINCSSSLSECRPTKVKFYIKGEVVRLRESTKIDDCTKERVTEWMDHWCQNFRSSCDKCFHDKPILHLLHKLNNGK